MMQYNCSLLLTINAEILMSHDFLQIIGEREEELWKKDLTKPFQ